MRTLLLFQHLLMVVTWIWGRRQGLGIDRFVGDNLLAAGWFWVLFFSRRDLWTSWPFVLFSATGAALFALNILRLQGEYREYQRQWKVVKAQGRDWPASASKLNKLFAYAIALLGVPGMFLAILSVDTSLIKMTIFHVGWLFTPGIASMIVLVWELSRRSQ